MSTDHFVLGTAGHIDHGKTSLVKALTGVDTDRLKEEKSRGITIELGFASMRSDEVRVGLVDVPGHERFIRAMAAGASGVDAVMLVVAADEGVMPQTREHIAVCSLLGVQTGFIALTKVDLAGDPEWLELARGDVAEATAGTFLEGAPIIDCSATTGAGLEAIRAAIFDLARTLPERENRGFLRLPTDRVFTMRGFGTVVTGTLVAGSIRVGDEVVVRPPNVASKVRGLQVHGADVDEAFAGQRTAVNLQGLERGAVSRGDVITRPGELAPTYRIDAQLRLLGWLPRGAKRRQEYILLHGTTQIPIAVIPLEGPEIAPGQTAWAQLHLSLPLVALPGDRFVLQGFQQSTHHGSTVGGGIVVRNHPARRRRPDAEYVALLERLATATAEERLIEELRAAGMAGLTVPELAERLPYPPADTASSVDALLARQAAPITRYDTDPVAVVHREPLAELAQRIETVVGELAEASPLATSFGREEVRSRAAPQISPRLFRIAAAELVDDARLTGDADTLGPPPGSERTALHETQARIAQAIEAGGLEPPKAAELATQLEVGERDVRDALGSLVREGRLLRAKDDLVFGRQTIDALQGRLVAFLEEKGEISPTEFKQMCQVSRKYLIPLAELFDDLKVTLRVGNTRKLRR